VEISRATLPVRQLISNTVLGKLPAVALDELCLVASVRHYKLPTLLCSAGESCQHVWLIVEGRIDMFDRQIEGVESIVGVLGPGRWSPWISLFSTKPMTHDTCAAKGTTVIAVSAERMRQLLTRHAEVLPHVIGEIAMRMQLLIKWTGLSAAGTPIQRMAGLLYCLAELEAVSPSPAVISASQTRLAQSLGVSRQLVARCLDKLEREGLIHSNYGRIEIADLRRLEALLGGACHGKGHRQDLEWPRHAGAFA